MLKRWHINSFGFLLIGLFLLNLSQAFLTPIIGDEAYYWVYSQDLAWGYFDHPPMVALLIKLSSFMPGVLGVRIFTVILSVATAYVLWCLVPEKNRKQAKSSLLFIGIYLAMPIAQLYGFITTPDVPLLFFFTLYLLALKRFSAKSNWQNTLFFSLTAALLIYSKYHGGILILLSVIFIPKLLKSWKTYLAGIFALIVITPHIYWQIENDFITFDYHLFQRTDGSFTFKNVGLYLLDAFGVLNPFLVLFFMVYAFKRKTSTLDGFYPKIVFGILGFFFLYAFRAQIEAHWVAAAFLPLILVLHDWAINNENIRKRIKPFVEISLAVLLLARLAVILPLPVNSEFHSQLGDFYSAIEKEAKDKPVVFVNSYQKASKYTFYTGEEAMSYNNMYYRNNQYDIGNFDKNFNGKNVFVIFSWPSKRYDSIQLTTGDSILTTTIDNFIVTSKLKATLSLESLQPNASDSLNMKLFNGHDYPVQLNTAHAEFRLILMKDEKIKYVKLKHRQTEIQANDSLSFTATFATRELEKGNYTAFISFKANKIGPKCISRNVQLTVR